MDVENEMPRRKSGRSSKTLKQMDLTQIVENLKMGTLYDDKDIKEIFNEMDKNSEGEISFNDFIKTLIEKSKTHKNDKFSEFYVSAINFYLTPSEQIIETIKKAIGRLNQNEDDAKLVKELEWVMNTLSENDLFDFRLKEEFVGRQGEEESEVLKFLSEYSHDVYKQQKNKDLESINSIQLKKKQLRDCKIFINFLARRSSLNSNMSDDLIPNQNVLSRSYSLINMDTLRTIDDFNFNIFKFKEEVGKDMTLPAISNYIFANFDLFDTICFKNFEMFLTRTRLGYKNNPFHNDIHAADVLQTCMTIFRMGGLQEKCDFTKLDTAAVFVSSILHDIGHPGLNNTYHMNKMNKLALRYNDKSVLENLHCYEGFKIIKNSDSNILEGLQQEEVRVFRKRMIESILATDMSSHTKIYSTLKCRIDSIYLDKEFSQNKLKAMMRSDDNISKFEKQQDFINFIVHTSDISNPAKQFEVYSRWTDLIVAEFFAQGDLEKKENLPISFLCDRSTTNVPKSQVGFINTIVWPLFKILTFIIPEVRLYETNLETNSEIFKKQIEAENK